MSKTGDITANPGINSLLLNNIYDAVIITNQYGVIIEWNKAAVELTGFSKNEALGKTPFEIINSDKNSEDLENKIISKLDNDEKASFELYTLRRDKTEIITKATILPIKNQQNDIQGSIIILRDISNRKRLRQTKEAFLEVNKALLQERSIFEKGNVAIIKIANKPGLPIQYVSSNILHILGYDSKEMMEKGFHFVDIIHKDDKSLYLIDIQKAIDAEYATIDHMEYRVKTKSGKTLWLYDHYSIIRDSTGEPTHFIGYFMNITERKQMEREREVAKSLVFENMFEGVFITDLEARIIEWNKSAEKMFGFTKQEVIGKSPFEIIYPESVNQENISKKLINDIDKKGYWSSTFSYKTKTNKSGFREIRVYPLSNEKKQVTHYISFSRDVTDKIIAEKKLEQKNKELEALSNMKDEFLSVASHDLRTPFTGIINFAEILLEDPDIEKNPETKAYIEMILESAENQLKYVNAILDVLQLENGAVKLEKEKVLICDVIESSVKNISILAKKKNIEFIFNDSATVCQREINIDIPKIIQVLNNLISNAIKFTPEHGKVEIYCEYFISKEPKEFVKIHVTDNGLGIPEEHIRGLFSRYKQVYTSGTSGEAGTGLGLSICKNLVELHGGQISVDSKVNQGSDFYFTLPLPG